MGRAPCCEKDGLKKGPWTPEEDHKLTQYIQLHGAGNWRSLPKKAGLQRCGKSCRLRWTNYLRPDIKRGRFSFEEEETIIQLHSTLGNKWSAIAAHLPGRTDNEIKNFWNTHIRRRFLQMGIDPVTHIPRLDLLNLSAILTSSLYNPQLFSPSNLLSPQLLNPEILKLATTIAALNQVNNLNENLLSNFQSPPLEQQFQNQFQFPSQQISPYFNNVTNFTSQENSNPNNIFANSNEFGLNSVFSSSTPESTTTLNSSSTFVNNNAEEDIDQSFDSNFLGFEIMENFNIEEFLEI